MIKPRDFLNLQIENCDIHQKHLLDILKNITPKLPISSDDVEEFDLTEKSIVDSLAHRFFKLQSTLGEKVFPALLEAMAEDSQSKSFIDILNRLEKLRILKSVDFWEEMRRVRNDINHDYPDDAMTKAQRINLCAESSVQLIEFFDGLKQYIQQAGL